MTPSEVFSLKSLVLTWLHRGFDFLPNLLIAALTLWACILLTNAVGRWADRFYAKHFQGVPVLKTLTVAVFIGFFWFIGIMIILDALHLTAFITHILAGAGILGIIGGLALKDVVSNGFAGLLIRVQRPFKNGDWVHFGDYIGKVHAQGLLLTEIHTLEGSLAFVPNEAIFNGTYTNFSSFGECRVILSVGVSYGDDLDHVEAVALNAVRTLPMTIRPEMADLHFTDIGSSTYNFAVRFWTHFKDHRDLLNARSAAIKAIKRAFEAEGISVAYNVTTLDFGVKGGVNLSDVTLKLMSDDSGTNPVPPNRRS